MKTRIRISFSLLFLTAIALPVHALTAIPDTSGFSGYVTLGAGAMQFESNMIAGSSISGAKNETIDSLADSPDSESTITPIIDFELSYTFSRSGTQMYLGNRLENMLRFDTATALGVRQKLPDHSIVSLSYLFSSFPTSVWEDPYVTGVDRKETDRTATGVRFGFDRILGSRLEAEFSWREISIDDEKSGTRQLTGLTPEQTALLDRNGTLYGTKLTHPFFFRNGQHLLVPSLQYNRYDLDGEAMAYDQYAIQLSHAFNGKRINCITNLFYGYSDYDEKNPIYASTREDDVYGVSFTTIYKSLLGNPKMNLMGTAAAYKSDSNIDFYDGAISVLSAAVLYRF